MAEQICKRFEERIFDVGKRSVSLNASVGVCLLTEKVSGSQMVLEKANEACRSAQADGGNRIATFDPAAQDKADAAKDREWLDTIKNALVKDGFILFYQPIVSLQGHEGEFYEVLLRMQQLVLDFPEIQEVEVNPFILGVRSGVAVDARVLVRK